MAAYEKWCDRCGKPIVFIRLTSGKYMPVDWRPVTYVEDPKARSRVVTQKGRVIAAHLNVDPAEADGKGYAPHFATCEAELARQRKRKEEEAAAKAAKAAEREKKPPEPETCRLCGAELPPDGKCDCLKYEQLKL